MIIHNLPDHEYHAHAALGSTTAKLALRSMRLLRDRIDGIDKVTDKPHFQIGRLAHQMILEPGRFAELVTDKGPINEKTGQPFGRGTKAFAEWQAANPGITVVEPWLYLAFERMPDEVCRLLAGGECESSVFQSFNGLEIKCRPDHLIGAVITDLKTIGDVDDAERHITRMKYWFSHAWYRMVMKLETGKPHSKRFVFVEKSPPFRWRIVNLTADYVMWADDQVDRVVGEIAHAEKTGDWADKGELEVLASMPDFLDDQPTDETDDL